MHRPWWTIASTVSGSVPGDVTFSQSGPLHPRIEPGPGDRIVITCQREKHGTVKGSSEKPGTSHVGGHRMLWVFL